MNQQLLEQLGLTGSQAKTYLVLIRHGRLTPPMLAKKIGESRTAAYMSLKKLDEIGLAHKVDDVKKQAYEAANPSALDKFIAGKKEELARVEEAYRDSMSNMLSYYYAHRGEPGIQYFQGAEGLHKIYEDHLRTSEEVYFVRTPADEGHFGDILYKYMEQRAKAGIESHGLAPFSDRFYEWAEDNDERLKRDMAWFPADAYTAPVEIAIYGNKVSLISFGNEAVGTIIESPQIARALRELFGMAKVGAGELMRRRYPKLGE